MYSGLTQKWQPQAQGKTLPRPPSSAEGHTNIRILSHRCQQGRSIREATSLTSENFLCNFSGTSLKTPFMTVCSKGDNVYTTSLRRIGTFPMSACTQAACYMLTAGLIVSNESASKTTMSLHLIGWTSIAASETCAGTMNDDRATIVAV